MVLGVHDNNSNHIKITDAENNATNYVYDSRNLEIERIFADSADANDKVVFTYDAVYRKISQLDQKGDLISYSYDMANRLLSRNYPDSKNDTFSYDLASRLTQAASARYDNTVSRTYNNDGTLASESLTTSDILTCSSIILCDFFRNSLIFIRLF